MKKRKVPPLPNPVLHFGSDVARDLIKEEVLSHFAKAFKSLSAWYREIHEGMLAALKANRQASDIRSWLLAKCGQDHKKRVSGLVNRYIRITDSDWRKKDFLAGTRDFWEASRLHNNARPAEDVYRRIIHAATVCCVKRDIIKEQFCADFIEYYDNYRLEHDLP